MVSELQGYPVVYLQNLIQSSFLVSLEIQISFQEYLGGILYICNPVENFLCIWNIFRFSNPNNRRVTFFKDEPATYLSKYNY